MAGNQHRAVSATVELLVVQAGCNVNVNVDLYSAQAHSASNERRHIARTTAETLKTRSPAFVCLITSKLTQTDGKDVRKKDPT